MLLELLQPFHTGMERMKVIQQLRTGQLPPELTTSWPHAVRIFLFEKNCEESWQNVTSCFVPYLNIAGKTYQWFTCGIPCFKTNCMWTSSTNRCVDSLQHWEWCSLPVVLKRRNYSLAARGSCIKGPRNSWATAQIINSWKGLGTVTEKVCSHVFILTFKFQK